MLACPECGRLVHADKLDALARSARAAAEQGDISNALAHWRDALGLLPADSKQHRVISAKITDLDSRLSSSAVPVAASDERQNTLAVRVAASLGAAGLMAWKFKALLLGLTKGTTLLSMLLSLGVYWTAWGWKFALGLVLSIYVHEMGHVIALRRYGFRATAPMFVPGLGALIRLQQKVVNPQEDAAIGLAGPIYGLGAAAFTLALWLATKAPIFAAIAGVGAWINLFNLLPIASLDGGRGFHAMSRSQKLLAAVTAGGAAHVAQDGLLVIIALVCLARAFGDKPNSEDSWKTAITYVVLIILLAAFSTVRLQAGIES